MGYSPENEIENEKKPEDLNFKKKAEPEMEEIEKDEKKKAQYEKMKKQMKLINAQGMSHKVTYSEKDTERMINKMKETNKKLKYSAHKTDF